MEELNPEDAIALDLSSILGLLSDAVDREVLQALDGTGLRRGHGYLVQRLLMKPATATELAEELGVTQQAMSKAVAELVALGHAESAPDPTDRRRRPLKLTARGRQAVETARQARSELDHRIRKALGDQRFESTIADLTAVMHALGLDETAMRRAARPPAGQLG